jgi:hypothetical protein
MWRSWIGISERRGFVEFVEPISALIKDLAEPGPLILVEPFVRCGTPTFMISEVFTSLNTFIIPNLTTLLPRQVNESPLLHQPSFVAIASRGCFSLVT